MNAALVNVSKHLINLLANKPVTIKRQLILVGAFLMVLMVACSEDVGNATSVPSSDRTNITPSVIVITPEATRERPATWTPTFTPTASPTSTHTSTATPILTPTFNIQLPIQDVCDRFSLDGQPREGVQTSYDDIIGFGWSNAPEGSTIVILFATEGQDDVIIQFPYSAGFSVNIALSALPTWGNYTWELNLVTPQQEVVCTHTGQFFREPWWVVPLDNPLVPPKSPS